MAGVKKTQSIEKEGRKEGRAGLRMVEIVAMTRDITSLRHVLLCVI